MKQNPISPDDPRLTAYALNEMEPAERAEFEQVLAQDATARQTVEDIAATASLLTDALEQEAMEPVGKSAPRHDTYALVIQFPYWKVSGLAAACFALFFIYWQRHEGLNGQKHYIEVPLTAAPAADAPEPVAVAMPAPVPLEEERASRDEMKSEAVARMAKKAQESAAREQFVAARNEAIESATQKARVAAAPMPAAPSAPSVAPVPAAAGKLDTKEETVVLSPFQVTAVEKFGYATNQTVAGSRVRTDLKDMATAVTVATGQFSADQGGGNGIDGLRQDSGYLRASDHPFSAFPAKVAAASYAEVQRFLNEGRRPPAEAVRIEELVNHFSYNYAPPAGNAPFSANLEVAGAPWAPTHRLVRIGLKARAAGEATTMGARIEPADGKLVIIAKDVQIQVEFNPAVVQAYRLIGYENRRPAKEDPGHARANVGVDGADQALTVLYEVVPMGVDMSGDVDALKYQKTEGSRSGLLAGRDLSGPVARQTDMLTVEIRYKEPAGGANRTLEFPLRDRGTAFASASQDFKFAAAVASFGMVLQDSPFKGTATMDNVAAWARDGLGHDAGGQRGEFLGLLARAQTLLQ